jgi:thiamine pyrophosphate-dependent acetolactate synthase large subunit-like protein
VAAELKRQGVDAIFGVTGEDNVKLCVEVERHGITYYSARDESVAVGMADGYSRVSGRLGVALISRGPGVTHGLSALVTAARARSGIVVIAGDGDPAIRHPKYVNQSVIFEGAGIPHLTIDSAESAIADLSAVCALAREGNTIVANFPGSILEQESGGADATARLPHVPPAGGEPDPEAIALVADLLGETWAARHPVILAGRGAVKSSARDELERLAEASGALVATTLMAKSLFHGNPFDLGIVGTYSTPPATELLREADVVLVFGALLHPFTTLGGELFPKATVIRFDSDPAAEDTGSIPVAAFIEGDARLSARALADELERRGHRQKGFRTDAVSAKLAAFDPEEGISDRGTVGSLDPRFLNLRLENVLPPDRTVVIDIGHHMAFSTAYLSAPDPRSFIAPLEYWCVGGGTGLALGAAIARPDRLTVFCVGDLGTLMTLGDLETAVRYELPLLVVITNDEALGAELHYLQVAGWPDDIVRFSTPSFAAVAQALGADGLTITSLDDVEQLRERVTSLSRPLIVDCRVTTEVRAEWFEAVNFSNLLTTWREPLWREPTVAPVMQNS